MGGYYPSHSQLGSPLARALVRLLLLNELPSPTPAEVGSAGERIVADWLRTKGYSVSLNTRFPGSADIFARGLHTQLLVQVKSALYPSDPGVVSLDETTNIRSRAARIGAQAWEARIRLSRWLNATKDITWRRLW